MIIMQKVLHQRYVQIKNVIPVFEEYSSREDLPKKDDDERRNAKIKYLQLI